MTLAPIARPRQPASPAVHMPSSYRIAVLGPREEPNAGQIVQELRDSIHGAMSMRIFPKLQLCHETLRCFWDNQTDDGRIEEIDEENDRRTFRWRGAPDIRIPLADKLVREHVLIDMAVWNRGEVHISPRDFTDASGDPQEAAQCQDVMDYYAEKRKRQRAANVRLWRTTIHEFGYGALYGEWQPEAVLRPEKLNFDAVLQMMLWRIAQETGLIGPDGSIAANPQQIMLLQAAAQQRLDFLLTEDTVRPEIVALVQEAEMRAVEEPIAASEAKRIVTQFRNGKLVAEYFREEMGAGFPDTLALIPWVNFLHGTELTGDGRMGWGAIPRWFCESDMRATAERQKWTPDFLGMVLEHANKTFNELQTVGSLQLPRWALNGAGVGLSMDMQVLQRQPMYQVFYVWRSAVNEAGLPMVYWTLVHPLITDMIGVHVPTRLKALPFLVETREPVMYAWQSRGIPEIVVDKQTAKKDLLDGEGARAQLGSNPPFERTMDGHVGIAPGIELHRKRSGKNEGNDFLKVPQVDAGAFKMCEMLDAEVNEYFFRGPTVDPELKQAYREFLANEAIGSYQNVWLMLWSLIQANVDQLKVSRIAGRMVNLDVDEDDLRGDVDIVVSFNSASFNLDSTDKFVEWLTKMSAIDRAGTVDWAEAAREAAMLWNPALARRLILPANQATKGIVDNQNQRIAQIMAGVPLGYEKQTSNPELRIEVMRNWQQQPGNVQRALVDPNIVELLNKEFDYLTFQQQQYQENRLTGQTGVKPNGNLEGSAAA